jgi:ABC-type amino acid transport substrate-binding protein
MGVLALASIALAACGGSEETAAPSPSASSSTTLTAAEQDWLAQRGTLQVGGFSDYPPFGFVDENGEAAGVAVDYWNLVADRLDVKVAFTPVLFAEQLDGLKQDRFDSLQGIFPLPEREQWFAFSQPYTTIDTRIYVDAAHAQSTTLESLKGLEVAVVAGDSGQQLADNAGLTTLVVKSYPEAVAAVAAGQAQAMIMDELVAEYYITASDVAAKVKAVGEPVAAGEMTLPVRKDDTVLLGILNKGVDMVDESELQAISDKWLGR